MASRKKYEAVATIGTYIASNGAEKKRYLNVGTVFENDEGRLSLKFDAVPVGQEWNGWISFFEPKERDQGRPTQDAHNQAKANGYQPQPDLPHDRRASPGMPPAPEKTDSDDMDDIPF